MTSAGVLVDLASIVARVEPLAVRGDVRHLAVTDVVFDHREVTPGALFCCLVGARHDGHNFAGLAHEAGAVGVICEHSLPLEIAPVQLVVGPGQGRAAMAKAACAFFGEPARAMRTVGVTGTNGKTTTTYLLRSIFEQAGWRAGVVGTLDGARTTPESPHLQRRLARLRDAGCTACALEVSSHSLVQSRVDGIVFDVAVFTNLSHDHLDFHESMEAYFAAKAELFRPERAHVAVVNGDDPYGRRLIDRPRISTIAYSLEDLQDLEVGVRSSHFRLGGHPVRLPLGGRFNVYNALGAAAAARALGVGADEIVVGLEAAPAVPGRFETYAAENITAVVDYAHTPAGLEQVLRAARAALPASVQGVEAGRVLVVFGCGGDRDRGKRPAMGAVAANLADQVVLTSDNPRSEDAQTIIDEIAAGMPKDSYVVEVDRRRAIARALGLARPGDVVVVAGKGHETTQQFRDRVVPFDDREVVQEELHRLAASHTT